MYLALTLSLLTATSPTLITFHNANWEKLKNKQHHGKLPLNSFPMNDHVTLKGSVQTIKSQKALYHPGFHSGSQRIEAVDRFVLFSLGCVCGMNFCST